MKHNHIIQILIFVTLAGVPLVFTPVGIGDFFVWPKLLVLRLIALIYIFWLFKNRSHVNGIMSNDRINRSLLIYFTWLIFATLFSMNIVQSIIGNEFRLEGLSTIMIYLILFLIAREQGTISKNNIKAMLLTGCIVVIYGIMQSYGIEIFARDLIRKEWVAAFSTIGNPNFLGTYIVLLLPFSVHFYIVEKRKIGLLIYTILFYGLLATMTRGTWIGSFFSVLIYLGIVINFREKFKIKFKDIMLFGFVTATCLLVFDLSNSGGFILRLLSISQDIGEVISGGANLMSTGSFRMFIWTKVVELIKMRPIFGFGLENLHLALEQFFIEDIIKIWGVPMIVDRAHNEYLHLAVSSGIPALLLYFSLIMQILRKGMSKLLELPYAIPLFVAVIGYLIQAFFNISVVSVVYIYWMFLGFMASSKSLKQSKGSAELIQKAD